MILSSNFIALKKKNADIKLVAREFWDHFSNEMKL